VTGVSSQVGGRHRVVSAETLGLVAVVLLAVQPVVVVALHVIQPEVDPLRSFDSEYALGRIGWLRNVGFLTTGLGAVVLAAGLRMSLQPGKRVWLGAVSLGLSGLAQFGTGLFNADRPLADGTIGYTVSGQLHTLFGLASFLGLVVAVFVLAGVFVRDPRWQRLARPTRWFAWWLIAALLAEIVLGELIGLPGLVQRIVTVPTYVWPIVVGWQVHRLPARSTT
jgi:hypothetical protein